MQSKPLAEALAGIAHTPHFFVWRLTWDATKGKYGKVPWDGYPVDAQLPASWMTFDAAISRLDTLRAGDAVNKYALGWMFTPGCGYWFLDLDGCVTNGVYSPLALEWFGKLPGVFFEFSSSGTGLHFVGRGELPPHASRCNELGAELYTEARGIAFGLSGEAWGCADVEAPAIVGIAAQHFPPRANAGAGQFDGPCPEWAGPADDGELLRRAMASKSGAAKLGARATFEQLWTNAPELDGFYGPESGSERDAALAQLLAFWTGKDGPRIERLMRQSSLRREKWDTHRTYLRELTIDGACARQIDVLHDGPRVDVAAEMYGAAPMLPASAGAVLPAITPEAKLQIEGLLDMVHSSPDWADVHNRVIPAIRAAGVPPALMPRLENAVNRRLDLWDAKLPVAKLRALLNPPRVAGESGDGDPILRPEWVPHFCYIQQGDTFFDLRDGTSMSRTAFNATFDRFMPVKGDGPDRHEAARYMLQQWDCPVVFDTMYAPGKGQVFSHEGRKWANLYSAASLPAVADGYTLEGVSAINRFQLHIRLICDGRERLIETLMAWLAHNVQRPGVKIRWAPIIKGVPGDGKSTIAAVMKAVMGSRNTMAVGPEIVCNSGGFTDWAHGNAFLALEEIHMDGKDRHKIANMIKPYISNNDATINGKGVKPKKVMNTCNQMAFTNYPDAIPIDAKLDRRWLVIFTPFADRDHLYALLGITEGRHHFDPIYDSLAREPGQWRKWLLEWPIPAWFDADGAAMQTDEKEIMADSGLGDVEMMARDIVKEGSIGISTSVISSACLSAMMRQQSFSDGVDVPKGHSLHHMLNRMGFVRVPSQIKWEGKAHRVWIRAGAKLNTQEIRQLLDDTKQLCKLL